MSTFQDCGSECEHVLALPLDFALDHGVYREEISHCRARRGKMRMQFMIRIGLPGCLIEAAIEVLVQEHVESNKRLRDLDMSGNLGSR